jgi:uncharacterized membrane protein YuzA (DUF378 family)
MKSHNCKDGHCSKGCATSMFFKILVIIGGINWGLVGVGMLLASGSDWNIIHLILGGASVVEAILYVLVGLASVMMIFGCKCSKCKGNTCFSCATGEMNHNTDTKINTEKDTQNETTM